ncbi:hypothetical protein D9757_009214 [Collybiopsis confluens]|uniref:Uncharacterized protein n=1 Tax=Collybiopsis confluens TaxID=2823264 RepID=A0A8H5M3N5_9AGAR|nr:hypothetical protein D9757_009214 [Collybiopsis confluens]
MSTSLMDFIPRPTLGALIAHRLFHQHCIVEHEEDGTPKDTSTLAVSYKNPHVKELFGSILRGRSWSALTELLAPTSGATDPTSRLIAGNVFEALAHITLPRLRETFYLVPMFRQGLTTKKHKAEPVPFLPANGRWTVIKFSNNAPRGLSMNTYYQGSHTTPLIDSFIFIPCDVAKSRQSSTLYFFQISVSQKKDSISLAGIRLVTDVYNAFAKKHAAFDVCFVLLQPMAVSTTDRTVWTLPDFGFKYRIFFAGLPLRSHE